MKTKSEVIAWLKTDYQNRVILVEAKDILVNNVATNFYLSNKSFVTKTSDTPSDYSYINCITDGVSFTESLSIESGSASLSYGDIGIDNTDGTRDPWFNYVWQNKTVEVYIGDVGWSREDFYKIFCGTIQNVDSSGRNSINITLLNTLQLLNVAISEQTITVFDQTSESLIPLSYGECFNVSPLLVDPIERTYQVHNSAINDIVEVRDNGYPVAITKDLNNGKFTLTSYPYGTITASIQGNKPSGTYSSKIGPIISNILSSVPNYQVLYATGGIFDTTDVGVYINNRENKLDICQKLVNSVGGFIVTTLSGNFKLIQLLADTVGAYDYKVTQTDMLEKTLTISEIFQVKGAVKLGYCKNWTVQEQGLAAGISAETATLFGKDWFLVSSKNQTVLTNYKQNAEVPQTDTLLVRTDSAQTESDRLLQIWSVPRFIYTATYLPHMLLVELGDLVEISHPTRFGISTPKIGQVVNISRNWLAGTVTIGLFI